MAHPFEAECHKPKLINRLGHEQAHDSRHILYLPIRKSCAGPSRIRSHSNDTDFPTEVKPFASSTNDMPVTGDFGIDSVILGTES